MNILVLQTIHALVRTGKEEEVAKLLTQQAKKGIREYYGVKKLIRNYSIFANKKSHGEKLVISATHKVDEKMIQSLKKVLNTPAKIKTDIRQNSNLGMGFVAEYNFKRIDASLARIVQESLQNKERVMQN